VGKIDILDQILFAVVAVNILLIVYSFCVLFLEDENF